MGQFLGFKDENSSLAANVQNLSTGYIYTHFLLFLMIYVRWLFSRKTMTVKLGRSEVILFISTNIGTPKRILTMLEISFIVRNPFTIYG